MGEEKNELTDDFKELLQKTSEANKYFFSEGSKLLTQVSSGKIPSEKLLSAQKDFWTDAIQNIAKLNMQYTNSLIDIGLDFTQKLNQRFTTEENPDDTNTAATEKKEAATPQPAFVLNTKANAGSTAFAHFLLDNNHEEAVECTLQPSVFLLQEEPNTQVPFHTTFTPQTFQLIPNEPQKIEIRVNIPANTKPGSYASHIIVDKNHGSYFTLYIQVTTDTEKNEENSK